MLYQSAGPEESPPKGPDSQPDTNSVRWRGFLRPRSRAWWVAGAYAVFALLWIYFSDRALETLIPDPEKLLKVSVYKGFGFVIVTSVLLLLVVRSAFGRIEDDYELLKAHEVEIKRLTRLYAALSQINQAIVWTGSRDELFSKVCRVLLDFGGFRIAWIGWHDQETQRLVPVAIEGDGSDYIESFRIFTDERPEGRGLSGMAFKEGRHFVCNDLLHHSVPLPGRDEAELLGLCASAAFPIRLKGEVFGTLSVYSDSTGFFQDKEIDLLIEAAVDISFALDNFAREEEREAARVFAENERRFSDTMIESMPGILYFYDESGRFLRWNRNFETVSGYSADEIATMVPLEFFGEEDRSAVEARISDVFNEGESAIEASIRSKDGTSTLYYLTGRRVEFDGRTCLVGAGIDISERRKAEIALKQSEQRYRTTVHSILEGCQIVGFDWTYLYLNAAAEVHNRRPNSELLGNRLPEMWPGIEATSIYEYVRRCLEDRVATQDEVEFTFPDGVTGWFDVRVQPVPEGAFLLSIDITERHQAEMALRELNENLEMRVTERTNELQSALIRAEAADRLKSAFLTTMSHELRTPLNSIIGFTGIILKGLAGPLNAEQTKQLGMVKRSAHHLLELINDVLDLSKVEAGQLDIFPEPFDVIDSIERAVETVKPLAEKKGLALDLRGTDNTTEIISDRRRVEQIMLNLLNNAIKFTESGVVVLFTDFSEIGKLRISVKDSGIGIKEEDMKTLFQPFRQIDSGLTREHEGTGLGLAICRRLAGLLGGEISAESTWGEGSVFTLVLPLKPCVET